MRGRPMKHNSEQPNEQARPPRVALVVSGLMFGGGQQVVLDLARELRRRSMDVSVVLLGRRTDKLDPMSPDVISYDGRYNRIGTLLGTAWRLRRYLSRVPRECIHTHGWDADVIGWLATLGTGIRQVAHIHVLARNLTEKGVRYSLKRFLTKRIYRRRDTKVIVVAEAVRREWGGVLPKKADRTCLIRNGVDVDRFSARPRPVFESREVVVGTAGRLSASKGMVFLLHAMVQMFEEGTRFRLRIAGDGRERGSLEAFVSRHNLEQWVEFCGFVDDMPAFYKSIDIFILPSLTEGCPLTLLESMCSANAVIATDIGGVAELITDGEDGLLVPPERPHAIAESVKKLLTDPEYRTSLGRNAADRVRREFTLERQANSVMSIYTRSASIGVWAGSNWIRDVSEKTSR